MILSQYQGEIMSLFDAVTFKHPVLRVNNRDSNIDFYEKTLGFKLVSEENAIAIFSAWENQDNSFIIEESPSMRTRAVEGTKKLGKIIVKTSKASDIEGLLANDIATQTIFKGEKGYAFEASSPEGHLFLLHAEDSVDDLVPVDKPHFDSNKDFKGLSDFTFEGIILNVPNQKVAQNFYKDNFEDSFPIQLQFIESEGKDLAVEPTDTWDLEILECQVPMSYDLKSLKDYFESKGLSVYLDNKEKVLVISDPSKIEIWFLKK